jgi:hypothetical protein
MSISFIFNALWGGVWNPGIIISTSDIAFFSYMALAACSFLSLLQLSRSEYLKKIGMWCGEGYNLKLLYASLILLLVKDIRLHLHKSLPERFVLAEWMILFFILLILVFILFRKINRIDKSPMQEELKKHVLEIKTFKSKDLSTVAGHIDEFVDRGDQARIMVYLVYLARDMNMSEEVANRTIVQPFLGYDEIKTPFLCFKREAEWIDELNKRKRREVLNQIITGIKSYGGNRDEY